MTMDHSQAMSTHAAERYALGEMDEAERDAFEAHFFECPECAEEVKVAFRFLGAAESAVRQDEPALGAEDAADSRPPLPKTAGFGVRGLFWPVPLGVVAAVVLVLGGAAVYLATVTVPRLERSLAQNEALQPAPWLFLSVSRSEPPRVTVSAGESWVGLTLSRNSDRSFPYYRCEIRDANDQAVLRSVIPGVPARDELQILVPTGKLRPGAYVLAVAGLESPSSATPSTPLTRYHFTLARGGERDASREP